MSNKVLGIAAAGLLSIMGSVANASILTPVYDSNWQTFSYDTSGYIGGSFVIGVSDLRGFTSGNSILSLKNLVGLSLPGTTVGVGSVGAGTVVLETVDGVAGGDCSSYAILATLGGDCSYITAEIVADKVVFDWKMDQGGPEQPIGNDTASDSAFYVLAKSDATGEVSDYLRPAAVPEPSTIALMTIGLLGAGVAARRKRD